MIESRKNNQNIKYYTTLWYHFKNKIDLPLEQGTQSFKNTYANYLVTLFQFIASM